MLIVLTLKIKLLGILPAKWVYLGTAENCNFIQESFGKTTGKSGERKRGGSFIERGGVGAVLSRKPIGGNWELAGMGWGTCVVAARWLSVTISHWLDCCSGRQKLFPPPTK